MHKVYLKQNQNKNTKVMVNSDKSKAVQSFYKISCIVKYINDMIKRKPFIGLVDFKR